MNTPTLTQRLDAYLEYSHSINQSPIHRRILRFAVLRTLRWLGETHGISRAEQVTDIHLAGWFRHFSTKRTRKGLPLRITSVDKQFQCDRAFFGWLAKKGIVPATLCEALPRIKLPHLLPTSVLDHKKMVRLLEHGDTRTPAAYRLRTMMEILYSSGMRVDELLSLDLETLDLGSGLIRVRGKVAKERMVPLGKTASRFFENYLRGIRPLLQHQPGETAVFLDDSGKRMPYHTFRRLLLAHVEDADAGKGVTAHTFRRTFATEMIRAGVNIYILAEILGHNSAATLHHYVKLNATDLKKTHAKSHPRERDYHARQD